MRKGITSLVLIALLVLPGCETDRVIFRGPYFVRFTEGSITEKESHSAPVNIEVHNAGPTLDEDVVVTYTITGDAREGVDFTISGERERVTIKKGEYFGTIQVNLINNSNNILRSQNIVFNLQTISTGKLQIGQGESAIGRTFTFTILDDCILGGDYIGHNGSTPAVGGITITSPDCITPYTLSNWNINIFTTSTIMSLKFIDNGDNTLTIPQQQEDKLPANLATIRGTGVVEPTTRSIIMTITLVDFSGSPEVSFTLTPN